MKVRTVTFLLALLTSRVLFAQVDVLTAQYNLSRTSSNTQETILTRANVNSTQFGKLFTRSVDAPFYASPLIVTNFNVPGVGVRNLVYIATVGNSVYAFDADDPNANAPYWSVNLGAPFHTPPGNVPSLLGILSTPVIDRSTNTIYVAGIVQSSDVGLYVFALDLGTGALKFNSPRRITYTFPSGVTKTDASPWIQRAALLLYNNVLYVGTSNVLEIDGDWESQEGFIQTFEADDLSVQLASFETTPTGQGGGFWQAGRGLAVDSSGNVFAAINSGAYNPPSSFGNSVVKFTSGTLSPADWFTPANWYFLYSNDLDVSANGVTLIPGTTLAFTGGKVGVIYLLDQNQLGGLEPGTGGNTPLQQFQASQGCGTRNCGQHLPTAFWPHATNPYLYVWDVHDYLRAFPFDPVLQRFVTGSATVGTLLPSRTGGMTISSNGSADGTGIVWATTATQDPYPNFAVPGTLRAYNANDITEELYDSDQNSSRDAMGTFVKMSTPIVANGKVYVNTQSNILPVYGLLSSGADQTAPAITSDASTTFTVGTPGTFTVITTGSPAPGLSESGALPTGVSFNASTGVLSGTPTTGTEATYPISFTANNGVNPSATQNFMLTVTPANQAPTITSATSTMFTTGLAGTFTVTATGYPTPTLSESGMLPTGLSFNVTTGVLSGTATVAGTYPMSFTARSTGNPSATQNFTLTVGQPRAGTVAAWGYNFYGELGNGTTTGIWPFDVATPGQIGNLTDVVAIAGGAYHTLALKSDGTVWAWGFNGDGELGNGTTINSSVPSQVLDPNDSSGNLTSVVAIAAGFYVSLALKSDGTVWAWGFNQYGALGNGTTTSSSIPVQVSNLIGVAGVAAGGNHSFAVKSDGTVWAWGSNGYGQLGNGGGNLGVDNATDTPVQVADPSDATGYLTGVSAIASGADHSLALKSDGTVWAWGDNQYGQVGNGSTTPLDSSQGPPGIAIATQVSDLNAVIAIAGGGDHSLALKSDGTVWAWGHNIYGELGNGATTPAPPYGIDAPIQVLGSSGSGNLTNIVAIAAGGDFSLALNGGGTVWAWGDNEYGELGVGTTNTAPPPFGIYTPAEVVDPSDPTGHLTGVEALAAGAYHSLALKPTIGIVQVPVPNVTANTQAAASAAIVAAGLGVGTVTQQSSSTVPAGDVIGESPAAGTMVNKGSIINLVISSGAPKTVPDIVGITQSGASTAILAAGLAVGTITQESSGTVPLGDVISESPAAGTLVSAGSTVALIVSSGPAKVVPNVVGNTQTAAAAAIMAAGLAVGTVSVQVSMTVPPSNVISQNPSAGTMLDAGSTVNLVLSSGTGPIVTFLNFDTTTQGNWQNKYGTDGYWVANGPQSLPSYDLGFAVQNQSNYTWASNTGDVRALQNGSSRIAATWFSGTSFSFDLNLTDAGTHQIAVYALDWDNYLGGRAETVQVSDASTGAVLDTQAISGFTNGIYLVWNISGHVKISVTMNKGGNAVMSGVFFGSPPQTAPAITSAATVTFAEGSSGTFTVTASGNPAATFSENGALPRGVSFNSLTGTLSGTPAAGSSGIYPFLVMASNSVGNSATQNFTLTVNQAAAGPQASFQGFDTATQGNWQNKYGTDGYSIANGPQSLPTYDLGFAVQNQSNYTWASNTGDVRAPQNGSSRIAATWFSGTSFSFDVNLTDAGTHQIAVYALDWDNYLGGRAETVQVSDASTGAVLDTQAISGFTNGIYLVWNISGHVKISVTMNKGGNAVMSGVFFGSPPQTAPAITSAATVTFAEGSSGTFTVTASGNPAATFSENGALPRGVSFNSLTGTLSGTPATGSSGTYSLIVTASNNVGANATQNFTLTVNQAAAGPQASFQGFDTATQGNWQNKYGTDGYWVANGPQSLPSYDLGFAVQNQSNYTWASNTGDVRALQNGSSRIAATWFSGTSFSFDVNLTDAGTHQIAVYALDWDNYLGGRAETVQVSDASTGAVLDTQAISGFTNGIYLAWNISGHVKISVTMNKGGNAVVSGVFFK